MFDQLRDNFASVTGDRFPLVPISHSEWRAVCSGRRNIQVEPLLPFLIFFDSTFTSEHECFH